MNRVERKRLRQTVLVGIALTLATLGSDLLGWLLPLERWAYDQRARYCQFFTPSPTDRLVHVDITDHALDVIGRWPWSRDRLAAIIRELNRADADVIALDIWFPEPQPAHDAELARAIDDAGNVLVPARFKLLRGQSSALERAMQRVLQRDPALTEAQVVRQLPEKHRQIAESSDGRTDAFLRARRRAVHRRIIHALADEPDASRQHLLATVLPDQNPQLDTPLTRLFEREFHRAKAMQVMRRFSVPASRSPVPALPAVEHQPSIAPFLRGAASSGFVDYPAMGDGVVRAVPLWVAYQGRLYPQAALAAACMALDVDVADIQIERGELRMPRPDGGDVRVPVRRQHVSGRDRSYGLFFDIPWFGPPDDWVHMYTQPGEQGTPQHMPILQVWEIIQTRRRIRHNNEVADRAIQALYRTFQPNKLESYEQNPPEPDDIATRRRAIEGLLGNTFLKQSIESLKDAPRDELDASERSLLKYHGALKLVRDTNEALAQQLEEQRASLANAVADRVAMVGFTASGVEADVVPTSLHANKAPGVVLHGAIFNAIINGDMWRRAAPWVGGALIVLFGLLTTALVAALEPLWAALGTFALVLMWIALNGVGLFDYGNLIVPAAAPLTATVSVWAGGTLSRYFAERVERARITRRFRSYVDPALVNYVLEHPEQAQLTGEVRELTVVFTDLAGFTTLSEQMGPDAVSVLNRYMGRVVPLIRERHGYVNKFLGDGVMFFYGAPWPNEQHALAAVETVLAMNDAMTQFNHELRQQHLPTVEMRAGVVTGRMVVGDAGPPDASDYTVLGDPVNTAARLQAANKTTGTHTMISARTVEMLENQVLVRPLGLFRVPGKREAVMVYEPLTYKAQADDAQYELAAQTDHLIERYQAGQFEACLEKADELDARFGPSTLTELYRQACQQNRSAPPAHFTGELVLTEK